MGSSIELVENTQTLETNLNNQLQQKLLLIENDHYLSKAFMTNGNQLGYQTTKICTGEVLSQELKSYLVENRPNMIVVDIGFAENMQLLIVRDLRALFDGLIVVVSSKNCEQEHVDAFTIGADDYLLKPIDSRILMMRIAALFRRQKSLVNQVELASLSIGDVCLQPKSQKCFINGEGVKLTTFEFNLLKSLVEHQGKILSRDQLYSTLLGRVYNGVERTLDVRMSQLREKLTLAGMKKNQIETVWGQGYMFNNLTS
ncbi:response regulator transcription factor [Colwellia psychrerythraea]|uniref:Two component transcriptional regulator, winged helix family n=1 Tax=Colwellia psychrerythraea TaxID=28229 RepID=A0A099KHY8_COLPS|nr:response regulator transcription factor [Colwellia psychrerythraea]KGJ90429.1 two component transcriptional regulator, winged helix family [Colwellia psychrerythraea]